MVRARITSKGQLTIPLEIRRRYRLKPGDEVDFRGEKAEARMVPLHRRRLSEFAGMFPATKPHASRDEIRREVGRKLGEDLDRKLRRR